MTLKAGHVNTILSGSYEQFEAVLKTVVDMDDLDPEVGANARLF